MAILNVDTIRNSAGSGAPDFPNGLTISSGVNITSGSYTPTVSSITGFGSLTNIYSNYSQLGNIVFVTAKVEFASGVAATGEFRMTLPVARSAGNFVNAGADYKEAHGVCANNANGGSSGFVFPVNATQLVQVSLSNTTTVGAFCWINFSYSLVAVV